MSSANLMPSLFQRLAAAGVDRSFVTKVVLPFWWDEAMTSSQPGFAYTAVIVASRLGLDLKAVMNPSAALVAPKAAGTRYKLNANVTTDDVVWARSIAVSAGRAAIWACKLPHVAIPVDPQAIHREIKAAGQQCVTLTNLLDYLWAHGVPVIHVCKVPKKQKRMVGLAAMVDGRPVIVLCKREKYSAQEVFVVAHEAGHVSRHLKNNAVIFDEKIDREYPEDNEEKEANDFAARVLTGSPGVYGAMPRYMTASTLAKTAKETGKRDGVDPGVVAMSYAHGKQFYPVGVGACSVLEGPNACATEIVLSKMREQLDLEQISKEDRVFLLTATGLGEKNAVPVGY